ncbi:hypothetical protein [Methylomonas sp. Kb3]|uniref:hypothetical protein n=1 Tax=Methylomonas sp. Kb3 TaxID=1611544 RepID=UPI001F0BB606|nr:hypothetical protein [Methylomonas sp. Kb3]
MMIGKEMAFRFIAPFSGRFSQQLLQLTTKTPSAATWFEMRSQIATVTSDDRKFGANCNRYPISVA